MLFPSSGFPYYRVPVKSCQGFSFQGFSIWVSIWFPCNVWLFPGILLLSFRYLWIIHGSPPSQPGGARLLLGDGTQFIKTCRASITSLTRRKRDETSAVSSTSVFALRPWIQMEVSRSGASLIAGWFLMENP